MIGKILDAGQPWAIVIIACCIFLLGLKLGYAIGDVKVSQLEKQQVTTERDAVKSALERLVASQQRSDVLEARLHTSESLRLTQAQEHQREIKRLTTGRPCLNRGTVSLLNSSTGIQPATLPEAPGRTLAEDAPAATDTDVAEWIDHAIGQYDTCRDRLGALIDYYQGESNEQR